MKQPVIIAAKRIAFGKYGGRLRHLEPESLLEPLFNHFTDQYPKVMSLLDDVILGNTVGNGGNLARKSLLEAGLDNIPSICFFNNFSVFSHELLKIGRAHV